MLRNWAPFAAVSISRSRSARVAALLSVPPPLTDFRRVGVQVRHTVWDRLRSRRGFRGGTVRGQGLAHRPRRSGFCVRQWPLPRRLPAGDERAGLRRGTAAADREPLGGRPQGANLRTTDGSQSAQGRRLLRYWELFRPQRDTVHLFCLLLRCRFVISLHNLVLLVGHSETGSASVRIGPLSHH